MSDESEDGTENVFDADCCNGIVAVVVVVAPFCGGDNSDGNEDVEESGSDRCRRILRVGGYRLCVKLGWWNLGV